MSGSIDQRIVEMQFNNKQFESGIKDSLGSLDKLKKGLDFESAAKGLTGLSTAASRFSLAGIGSAVDTIASRFSALGIMGVTALANIANSAVNAGKQLLNSLTLAPISKGFAEYEQGLSAFQTIYANTQSQTAKVSAKQVNAINATAAAATKAAQKVSSGGSSAVSKSQTQQVRAYQKAAAQELDILQNTHDKAADALDKAIKNESASLEAAHQGKLKLYNDEYMAKLKLVDEERYNKIKLLDDQISVIDATTKAEEDVIQASEEQAKLQALQAKVRSAKTVALHIAAEQAVTDYQAELARNKLLLDRKMQIASLEFSKDTITKEYDLIISQLDEEYKAKVENENNLSIITSENLKTQQDEKLKVLRATQKIEKDLLNERQTAERDAQSDRQASASSGSKTNQTEVLAQIEARRVAEIKALQDAANAIKMPSSIQDIDDALLELNGYANKTIYSFGDMTKAIGLFTSQGVNLEDSVTGIKGIFNIVSLTGGTADKANSAIYQLSQAIANGTVRAQDWISVVNAGIGGTDFQNQLKQTARMQGIAVDEMISKNGSFKASLEEGWLSSSVLLETLQQYTGDITDDQLKSLGYSEDQVKQIKTLGATANDSATKLKSWTQLMDTLTSNVVTGWAASFKILLGNLDEATVLWTGVGNAIGGVLQATSDSRNAMLQTWDDMGGRETMIQAIVNAFDALKLILKPISEAFRTFFPPTTGEKLLNITIAIRAFTERLKISTETAEKVKRIFSGVFAVLDIGKQVVIFLAKGIGILLKALKPARDVFVSFSATIGDWLVSLDSGIKTSDFFATALQKFSDIVTKIATFIKTNIEKIGVAFGGFGGNGVSAVQTFSDNVQGILSPLSVFIEKLSVGFLKIIAVIKKIAAVIGTFLKPAFDKLREMFSNATENFSFDKFIELLEKGLLVVIILAFKKFFDKISGILSKGAEVLKSIKGILDGVRGCLEAYQNQINAGAILKIAIAVGILALAIALLSTIDPLKIAVATGAITAMFVELVGALKLMSLGNGIKGVTSSAFAMIGISIALLIMASAIQKLALIPWEDLGKAGVALLAMSLLIVTVAKLMSLNEKNIIQSAASFILFSIGIGQLAKGLKKLIEVIELMGSIDEAQLKQGLIGLGILLGEILLFTKISKIEKMGVKQGLGMIAFAFGLSMLANAVNQFAQMDPGKLTQGLVAIGTVLTAIGIFLNVANDGKNIEKVAIGLVLISGAMLVFTKVVEIFGNMPIDKLAIGLGAMAVSLAAITAAIYFMPKDALLKSEAIVAVALALVIISKALAIMGAMSLAEIGKGLLAVAGVLLILVIAINNLSSPKTLLGAAALVIVSAALMVLARVLVVLAALSIVQVGIALAALAGVLIILAVAVNVFGPTGVATLMGLAAAIALIGLSVLAVGAGLLLFSAGLAALAVSGAAGGAVLVSIALSLIALIPIFLAALALGFVAFVTIIGENAERLAEAFKKIFIAIIDVIITVIPLVVKALGVFIKGLMDFFIVDAIPRLIDAGFRLIKGILKGINDNIGEIIQSGTDIALKFINGITSRLEDIIDAAYKFIIGFINGLSEAIRNNSDAMYDACYNLITAIVDAIKSLYYKFAPMGKDIVDGLIKGIKDKVYAAVEEAKKLGRAVIDGIKGIFDSNSPSKVFATIGGDLDKGLVVGLQKYSSLVSDQAIDVGKSAINSLSNSMSNFSDIISGDLDMSPTIRPVLDLTDIQTGAKQLNSMLPRSSSINLDGSISKANMVAQTTNSNAEAKLSLDMIDSLDALNDTLQADNETPEVPAQINFNGSYSFGGKEDIDYFMNQAALLVQRRKS